MDDKSYVSLKQRLCLVCSTFFDTRNLLLDKRLRASMKRRTTTGWACVPSSRGWPMKASSRWSNAIRSEAVRQRPMAT